MARNRKKVALHSTVLSGNTLLVKDMLKNYKSINYVDESYNTPLHVAAIKGYVEIVRMLLTNGAHVDMRNHHGSTPLHLAIQFNNTSTALELLSYGADVNIKDRYGETALHLAVSKNNIAVVTKLIEEGAQINSVNFVSMTPLAIAIKNSNSVIISILRNSGAVMPKDFFSTAIYAFRGSNIYRKTVFFAFAVFIFSLVSITGFLSVGTIYITATLATIATIGAALICFGRPYQRVRALERMVLNELMTQEDLDKLMLAKRIEVDNKGIFNDAVITCQASNDNAKVVRSTLHKKRKKSKKIC